MIVLPDCYPDQLMQYSRLVHQDQYHLIFGQLHKFPIQVDKPTTALESGTINFRPASQFSNSQRSSRLLLTVMGMRVPKLALCIRKTSEWFAPKLARAADMKSDISPSRAAYGWDRTLIAGLTAAKISSLAVLFFSSLFPWLYCVWSRDWADSQLIRRGSMVHEA
jgi:hypothetical protein